MSNWKKSQIIIADNSLKKKKVTSTEVFGFSLGSPGVGHVRLDSTSLLEPQ